MQLATPPPPQPVVAPAAASAGPLLKFEERVHPNFLLAHGGGESHEGLDVPYKLVKYKDNKFLHMSEEEKHEWEKKLTGEDVDEAEKKKEALLGNLKLFTLWSPLVYAYMWKNDEKGGRYFFNDKTEAMYNLGLLLAVPICIVLSGMVYPDAEWEKVQEILTWLVVWAPAVAIWAFTKVLDGLRSESVGRELIDRR
jgi:hypothetical protein